MGVRVHLAVDAMSGDFGPRVTLPAALRALEIHPRLTISLVGRHQVIEADLNRRGIAAGLASRIRVEHAEQVLPMDAAPRDTLRGHQSSSLHRALHLLGESRVDGVVSAGSTAALLALGRRHVNMMPGFSRPALCSALPVTSGVRYMMDLGANVDCDADSLIQFARLGTALVTVLEGCESPRVALLSNGTEANKGNVAIRQAAERMKQDNAFNYCGFIEADALHRAGPELVICDGLLGNVALKSAEGTAEYVAGQLSDNFSGHWWLRLVAGLASPALKKLRDSLSADSHGGAFLLGLQGVVVKSHGGSNREAFYWAVEQAARCIENGMIDKLTSHLHAQTVGDVTSKESSIRDS